MHPYFFTNQGVEQASRLLVSIENIVIIKQKWPEYCTPATWSH
jgi:hypothetical protein